MSAATLPVAVVDTANRAERSIALFTQRLDAGVWGTPAMVAAVRALAIAHASNRVRVLIREPQAVLVDGDHRLVNLARTLPSRIALRAAPQVARAVQAEWLLVDRAHYLLRDDATHPAYRVTHDNPGHTRRRLAEFDRYWEHGETSRELAELRL